MPDSFAKILAIETASPACSVALMANGKRYERCEVGNNIHSQVILNMVDHVLQEAALKPSDLHLVVVGQGPGSFTGLRIGIGVAQGLAYGAKCPMLGISSLDALAAQVNGDGQIIAALDARMGEVYWAEYEKNNKELHRHSALQVTPPEMVTTTGGKPVVLVGNAWTHYVDRLNQNLMTNATRLEEIIYPQASALLNLAIGAINAGKNLSQLLREPTDFTPVYVRNNVAKKSLR